MLTEYGVEDLQKNAEYDRTLLILKSFFRPTHYIGIQIYEEYLNSSCGTRPPPGITIPSLSTRK
ncbi:MAG: hypothetical protein WDN75_08075 [Bacteroidota bacterium]